MNRMTERPALDIDRLRDAIQWAIDEYLRDLGRLPEPEPVAEDLLSRRRIWGQGWWGSGVPTEEKVEDQWHREYRVICPTSCCIAGNITAAAGDKFIVDEGVLQADDSGDIGVSTVLTKDNQVVFISTRAAHLLNVENPSELDPLFDGENEIRDVIEQANALAHDYGHPDFIDSLNLHGVPLGEFESNGSW